MKQKRPERLCVGPSVIGTPRDWSWPIARSRSATSKARCTRSSGTFTAPLAGKLHSSISSAEPGTSRKASSEPRGEVWRSITFSPRTNV
jgi:hypothetical protein